VTTFETGSPIEGECAADFPGMLHLRRASRTCWRARAGARTRRVSSSRTASVRLSSAKPRCCGMRAHWTPGARSASRQPSPARRSAEPTAACPGPQRHPCRARTSAQSIRARCMLSSFPWVPTWFQALEGWLPVFNNGAGGASVAPSAQALRVANNSAQAAPPSGTTLAAGGPTSSAACALHRAGRVLSALLFKYVPEARQRRGALSTIGGSRRVATAGRQGQRFRSSSVTRALILRRQYCALSARQALGVLATSSFLGRF
jgi:hypothetical protein